MAWRDNGETDASRRQSSLAGRWTLAAILMAFAFCALLLLTPRTWAWVSWTWIALIAPFVMMFRHRLAEQQLMHAERSRRGIRYGNKFGQWAFYDHPVLSVGLFLIVVVVPLSRRRAPRLRRRGATRPHKPVSATDG